MSGVKPPLHDLYWRSYSSDICRSVLSVGLQNIVGAEYLSPMGIKPEECWTMLKKVALLYYDFLGHTLEVQVGPFQKKRCGVVEIPWIV